MSTASIFEQLAVYARLSRWGPNTQSIERSLFGTLPLQPSRGFLGAVSHGEESKITEEDCAVFLHRCLKGPCAFHQFRIQNKEKSSLERTPRDQCTGQSIPRSVSRRSHPGYLPVALFRLMMALEAAPGLQVIVLQYALHSWLSHLKH